jgi:hypothetical protein
MNSKLTQADLYSRLSKSITDLLDVLGQIDENDATTAENEWSIEDNNGGRILLGYDPATKDVTITRGDLNIVVKLGPYTK